MEFLSGRRFSFLLSTCLLISVRAAVQMQSGEVTGGHFQIRIFPFKVEQSDARFVALNRSFQDCQLYFL